ncbi:MAG TPA: glycosyltransferase family 39 protein, partial [Anaerolineae bacterium]|nr:glycosyltransferase family 39 protein [Anaerolineae bacterium]
AQMVIAAPQQSAAFDEGYTLTYGYGYLRGGDPHLSRGQNPPLTNVFLALPVLLKDNVVFPDKSWNTDDIFGFTDQLLWQSNVTQAAYMIQLARLPEMALALILACVVFAFTRFLFDEQAALCALLFCAFDPNLLAHGHTAGTDLGVTLFMFSSVFVWTTALKRSSWKRAALAGVLAGAAFATKYSSAWLVPILALVTLLYPGLRNRFLKRCGLALLAGVLALIVIWGTFQFTIGPINPGGLTVPAPQYWQSLGAVRTRVELNTPAFMLGAVSPTGFLAYYPFVFVVKTPLPTLIFLVLGVTALFMRHRRADVSSWIPPLLFMLAAMFGGLNLGYRLMLPVLPFALMIAGLGARTLVSDRLWGKAAFKNGRRALAAVLSVWLMADVLAANANHLAYFNSLIDHARDYQVLVDSNLDWGQDWIALQQWQQAHPTDRLSVAYYGSARPQAYGADVKLLPSFSLNDYGAEIDGFTAYALPPGTYAISASSLQLGLLYSHLNLYAPFRAREPLGRVGRSFLLYNVAYPDPQVDRTVVLGPQASDLDTTTLGLNPDRQLIVKWAGNDALVLDMQSPARYITRGGETLAGFAPEVHQALIDHGTKLGSDVSGDLRLWEIDARSALSDTLNRPRGLTQPIGFAGGLKLIGYDLRAEHDQPIDLVTYWRVDRSLTPPISLFVHAVDATGNLVAQHDGLNVRLSSLEPGDVIVQHSVLEHLVGAAALEIGLYDPASGQRQLTDQNLDHVELTWK